jgi:hypothetical protein
MVNAGEEQSSSSRLERLSHVGLRNLRFLRRGEADNREGVALFAVWKLFCKPEKARPDSEFESNASAITEEF